MLNQTVQQNDLIKRAKAFIEAQRVIDEIL